MKKELNYIEMPSWFYPRRLSTWSIKWIVFYTVLYLLPWLPTPFTYTKEVYTGLFGMPLFVWGMIAINVICILSMFVFYNEAKKVGFLGEEDITNGGEVK